MSPSAGSPRWGCRDGGGLIVLSRLVIGIGDAVLCRPWHLLRGAPARGRRSPRGQGHRRTHADDRQPPGPHWCAAISLVLTGQIYILFVGVTNPSNRGFVDQRILAILQNITTACTDSALLRDHNAEWRLHSTRMWQASDLGHTWRLASTATPPVAATSSQDESRAKERNEHDRVWTVHSNRFAGANCRPSKLESINSGSCSLYFLHTALVLTRCGFGRRGATSEWRQTWFMSAACY
jgi:hypothetical protein